MRFVRPLVLALFALTLSAQSWDTSGDSLLSGTWYFRNVVYVVGDNQGNLSRALATYGQISFSGTGTYTLSGSVLDSDVGAVQNLTTSGTYSISSSGYGWISHPLSSTDSVYGLVSNGVFVASSTEGGFNDLFIAARLDSPQATVAALRGSYTLAYIELSDGSPYYAYDARWQMSPDGAGNLGTVALRGYSGSTGASAFTQNISNVKYIFSNGAANMQFPKSTSNMLAGNEYLYLSPDGNFVFGGSPEGFDFFVGVRNPSSGASLGGFYYQAGLDLDDSTLASGYGTLSTFYGSFKADNGTAVAHQRVLSGFASNALDYTYADKYSVGSDGTYTNSDTSTQYIVGTGGIRVGLGIGPYLGINVAVPAGSFSGSGVYIYPNGIFNAASFAPFTAGVAPGEFVTLFGSGLAAETKVASVPFPNTLAGVQVTVNGTAAPLYFVSSGQISFVVPYGLGAGIAEIQVTNSGTASNKVSVFTDTTAPGVFTNPVGGLGYAAALHAADNSLVTAASPARIGEYISVYLSGLGAVTPAVSDGAAGPSNPLSYASSTIAVGVAGHAVAPSFAGLAPGFSGLYQINFQVPAGLATGDASLTISGPDSFTAEALLPVSSAAATASVRR